MKRWSLESRAIFYSLLDIFIHLRWEAKWIDMSFIEEGGVKHTEVSGSKSILSIPIQTNA
jgi:hypothetical protein